jgi:hypothetical protein
MLIDLLCRALKSILLIFQGRFENHNNIIYRDKFTNTGDEIIFVATMFLINYNANINQQINEKII